MQIFSEIREPVGLCGRQMMRSGSLRTSAADSWPTSFEVTAEVDLRDADSVLQPDEITAAAMATSISAFLLVRDARIDIALPYNFVE
jgi:hypothetical protein